MNLGQTALSLVATGPKGGTDEDAKIVLAALLSAGAEVNPTSEGQDIPLIEAADDGNRDFVLTLLAEYGADVNLKSTARYDKGATALMKAAAKGHLNVVEILAEFNAEVNVQNDKGETALMMAAENNHDGVVEFLLELFADASIVDAKGETAMDKATKRGHAGVSTLLTSIQ